MNKLNFRRYSYRPLGEVDTYTCPITEKEGTDSLIDLLAHMAHDRINILDVKREQTPLLHPTSGEERPDKITYIISLEVQHTPCSLKETQYQKPLWRKITYIWDDTPVDYETALAYGYYLALEVRARLETKDAGLEQTELGG